MQKLKQELNAIVGVATHSDPLKQKGITLIALIITIIVMLVLVGVTINVALNGGLFDKAETASEQMQIEAEKEELLSAVVAAIGNDGKVDFNYLDNNLPAEWDGRNGTYTSPKRNTYTVDEYGRIAYTGDNSGGGNKPLAFNWETIGLKDIDTTTEYIDDWGEVVLFFTPEGIIKVLKGGELFIEVDVVNSDNIDIDKEAGIIGFDNIEYYSGNTISVEYTVTMNSNNKDIDLNYYALNGSISGTYNCEKVEVDNKNIYSNEEILKKLGVTGGTYKGTWTKIGTDENGNAKLVSTSAVSQCDIGFDDPEAIKANPAVDESALTETEKLARSIWSYKNAIGTLDAVAQETTGIANARSIKIEDICDIIGEENVTKETKVYNYYYDTEQQKVYSKYKTGEDTWSEPHETYWSSQTFVDDNGNIVVVDSEGDQVNLTSVYYFYDMSDNQLAQTAKLVTIGYWVGFIEVDCGDVSATYIVGSSSNGETASNRIFDSSPEIYGGVNYVRAIISVPGL